MDKSYQDRVIAESADLAEKIEKLRAFVLGNPTFHNLDPSDKRLLERQLYSMRLYNSILTERIERFQRG